jgi:hypothetical protein
MTKLAPLALLVLASSARAQNVVAMAEQPGPPSPRLVDGRLGVLLGDAKVGDTNAFSPGISGSLGYRIGDVTLRALADYYRVGDDPSDTMARRGRGLRVGAAGRYSFAHTDYESAAQVDFWGELGAGYEHVAWLEGGVLDRPSGELAVGLDFGHRGDRTRDHHRPQIGSFLAFRTHIAEAPEMAGAVTTCGGPCSEPTKPPRTDVTMFFEMGVHWGR